MQSIEYKIYVIRGQRVMLDGHLAELYDVKPRRLREQVKRNLDRFPEDFMFQLTAGEAGLMVAQDVVPSWRHLGGFLPYVFTQEGVAMLSSVLRSPRAVQANIAIMRAFVRLRRGVMGQNKIIAKLMELQRTVQGNKADIERIFGALRELMDPPERPRPKIGFQP